jgi:DNA polymerase I-like protein with 3'-5' exonuclease and polymerase domains
MIVTFDVETNTINKGNPFTASGKLVSYGIKAHTAPATFHYHTSLDFLVAVRELFKEAKLLVGFNFKFDLHWASRYGVKPNERCRIWDCQLAEFIISGQKHQYPSLRECCEKYNLPAKGDVIAEYWDMGIDTEFIPKEELEEYCLNDVEITYLLMEAQKKVMTPEQVRLCFIMGLDLLALQEMEENGIKFDSALCKEKAAETKIKLDEITTKLLGYSPCPDINLDSGQHLSCLLYGGKFDIDYITEEVVEYKSGPNKGQPRIKNVHNVVVYTCPRIFEPLPKSETKLKKKLGEELITIYTTNEDTLKQLKAKSKEQKELIKLLLDRAELAKLLDTYYGKIPELLEKMEWGEYLHGQYNQCVAATGRLSSSNPNMQNFSGDVDKLLVSRYD